MMQFSAHNAYPLPERSYSGYIKRKVEAIAKGAGFRGSMLGAVNIITAELISNLLKHSLSKDRSILVKEIQAGELKGLEIISIDNGPGMADPGGMQRDGASTSKTLGQGLGAIKRLSHEFDLYTQSGWGTILLCRIYNSKSSPDKKNLNQKIELGCICVAKTGEEVCGDSWGAKQIGHNFRLMAMDGLGHGPEAHKASQAGIKAFLKSNSSNPIDILQEIHHNITSTRGGVAAILEYNQLTWQLNYCGIGNISAKIISPQFNKSLISYNGIVGMNKPSVLQNQPVSLTGRSWVVLASDGIKTLWDIAKYKNILAHDPAILAAVLYKDYCRGTDDTMVCVIKIK